MQITTGFDGPILRLISSGACTWAELLGALRRATTEQGFVPGRTILVLDCPASDTGDRTEEIRARAAELAELGRDLAAVVIVAPDDLRFGLSRMVAAYAEGEVVVFRSVEEGEAWARARDAGDSVRPEPPPVS